MFDAFGLRERERVKVVGAVYEITGFLEKKQGGGIGTIAFSRILSPGEKKTGVDVPLLVLLAMIAGCGV